ncbi:MAG: SUMF1/EgtB/PvdO family nonheme iron enzyme [Anaerolineae bacterium]|nr:SUMF1/EgtB/PvdO family nonheme iron enzyme [Anaerolineae bacterium]
MTSQGTEDTPPGMARVTLTTGQLAQIGDYNTVPVNGEQFACTSAANPDGVADHHIFISLRDANQNIPVDTRFDLYIQGSIPAAFDPYTAVSLDPVVQPPADILPSFSVGAQSTSEATLAWYSGRSNSLQYYELNSFDVDYSDDEHVRPNLVTYGELLLPSGREFFGTSAATPVVGGAAILTEEMIIDNGRTLQELRRILSTSWSQCIQDDGVLGRVTTRLELSTPNTSLDSSTEPECGDYEWIVDLSSTLISDFVEPDFVAARLETERLARITLSQSLADAANQNIENGHIDLAMLLSVEANRVSSTVEAKRSLLTALQSQPHYLFGYTDFDRSILEFRFNSAANPKAWGVNETGFQLWNIFSGVVELSFESGNSMVDPVVSPDGNIIAYTDNDRNVLYVDNSITGENVGVIRASNSDYFEDSTAFYWYPHAITFSPDNNFLAVASPDRGVSINLWDLRTGHHLALIPTDFTPRGKVRNLQFSSDNSMIAAGSDYLSGNVVHIWDIDGTPILQLTTHPSLSAFTLSPDNNSIAVSTDGNIINIYDINDGNLLTSLSSNYTSLISSLTFSHDGRHLISISEDGDMSVWYINYSDNPLQFSTTGNKIDSVTFYEDTDIFVTEFNSNIAVWTITPSNRISEVIKESPSPTLLVGGGTILPSGQIIIASYAGSTIYIQDLISGHMTQQIECPRGGEIGDIIFSDDGTILIIDCHAFTTRGDFAWQTVVVWNISTGEIIQELELNGLIGLGGLSVGPDNRTIAVSYDDTNQSRDTLLIWDIVDNTTYSLATGDFYSNIDFSPQGGLLADVAGGGEVNIWNVASGQLILTHQFDGANNYTFSLDESKLYVGYQNTLYVISVATSGVEEYRLTDQGIGSIILDQATGNLVVAAGHNQILILNPESRQITKTVNTFDSTHNFQDIDDDGRLLDLDGHSVANSNAHLWNLQDGTRITSLFDYDGATDVWFLSDDMLLTLNEPAPTVWNIKNDSSYILDSVSTLDPKRIAYHPDIGLVVLNEDNNVDIITIQNELIRTFSLPIVSETPITTDITISNDGRLISIAIDDALFLYSAETFELLDEFYVAENDEFIQISQIAISPDNATIAIGLNGSVMLVDVSNMEVIYSTIDFGYDEISLGEYSEYSAVDYLEFDPSGELLFFGLSYAPEIIVWDIDHQRISQTIRHEGGVYDVDFVVNSSHFVTAGSQGDFVIWDSDSFQPIAQIVSPLECNTDRCYSTIFAIDINDDSSQLATVGANVPLMVWDISVESWIEVACTTAGRNLTQVEWATYLGTEPYRETCPDMDVDWEAILIEASNPEENLDPNVGVNNTTIEADSQVSFELATQGVSSNSEWQLVSSTLDGIPMVLVPAGCFNMGSNDEQLLSAFQQCEMELGTGQCQMAWFEKETPSTNICFDQPFWIDQTEITNEQYGSSGSFSGNNAPRDNISWFNALEYCEARGGRLPTEAEWEYAARGPDNLTYPWGNTFVPEYTIFDDGNTLLPDVVGMRTGGASWVGALDLSGNLREWTSSIFSETNYPYNSADGRENTDIFAPRTVRGGSWITIPVSLRAMDRLGVDPNTTDWNIGFRCVIDVILAP